MELAAVGRRACEVELDVLDLLPVEWETKDAPVPGGAPPSDLHDRPSAAELLEAVREFLASLDLTGHDAFLQKVSDRVLRVVEREMSLGPVLDREHVDRLAGLGVADTQELATLIRMHRVAPASVATAIRAAVVAKLHVVDPRNCMTDARSILGASLDDDLEARVVHHHEAPAEHLRGETKVGMQC